MRTIERRNSSTWLPARHAHSALLDVSVKVPLCYCKSCRHRRTELPQRRLLLGGHGHEHEGDAGCGGSAHLEALEQLAATVVLLRPEHIAAVYGLAPIHKDPFDRMLIAQATVERLALVSGDAEIARYASEGLRVAG